MAVCKIKKFNPSYFSVYTILDSNTKTGTGYYDTFDEDNYSSTTFTSSSVGTSNVTFDPTNGRFTVAESGNYVVFYSVCAQLEVASAAFMQGRIDVDGSEVYESSQLYANAAIEPRDYLFSHVLQLSAGQYLNFASKQTSTAPGAGLIHEKGSYVSIFRIQNDYGQIVYNANGTQDISDKTMGTDTTSEISSSNNVNYNSSNGRFTVNADKKFLLFANVLTNINSAGGDSNMIQTINFSKNGSEIADAGAEIRQGSDPYQSAYSLIEDFQTTQYMQTGIEGDGVNPFQILSGSTTGIFDISYDANEPGAYLSFTCDSDGQLLTSSAGTDYNCFDETNWSSLNVVEFIPTTNITFTKSNGRFTFDRAGKYFIISQIVIDGAGNGKRTFFLKKNGATVYTSRFHLANNWLPREKSYCLIIDVAVDDYIEIGFQSTQVNDFFKQDSTISIFKIDSGTPALDLESRGLEVTTESTPQAQIADDFDLKTFDIDTLTPQRSRLTDQVPFVLGVPGPLSLRGRCFGQTKEPPIVKPGDKKS